jgi:TonB family protein
MSEAPARRARPVRFSRRAVLIASLAVLVLSIGALATLFKPRAAPRAAAPPPVSATVTADEADLKSDASAGARTVAKLARGTRLEIRRDAGLWVEVQSPSGTGFLRAESLERDSDRDARKRRAATVFSFPSVPGVVAEDAELRAAPFPVAAKAGTLPKGTVVSVYAVDHGYYALRGEDGGLAFIESSNVDLIPADPRQPAIAPAHERVLKNLEVSELAQPLPLAGSADGAGSEPPPPAVAPLAPADGGAVEPAELRSKVDPTYPDAARRAGVSGTVVLAVTIDADGRVTAVDVVRGLPMGLTESAVGAVRRWQYRPARGKQGPVASRKEVRIEFRLR